MVRDAEAFRLELWYLVRPEPVGCQPVQVELEPSEVASGRAQPGMPPAALPFDVTLTVPADVTPQQLPGDRVVRCSIGYPAASQGIDTAQHRAGLAEQPVEITVAPPPFALRVAAADRQWPGSLKARIGCGQADCSAAIRGRAVFNRSSTSFPLRVTRLSVDSGERVTKRLRFKSHRATLRKIKRILRTRAGRVQVRVVARDGWSTKEKRIRIRLRR